MTLTPGDHVEGRSKFILRKRGTIVSVHGEGRKRKMSVAWEDDTRGEYAVNALKKFAGAVGEVDVAEPIYPPSPPPIDDQAHASDEEDDGVSDGGQHDEERDEERGENEVTPEDGVEGVENVQPQRLENMLCCILNEILS